MSRNSVLIICLYFVNIAESIAQGPPFPFPGNGGGPGGGQPGLPIDGGIVPLAILGTVYGVFKIRRRQQRP